MEISSDKIKQSHKLLFLLDDGWRYEKRELLDFLKDKVDFKVITHDYSTHEKLQGDFQVVRIDPSP